jgi:UDP-GlcNAc:undecaprenyl-phosphate GlcNAc-1-phosphate transferase
MDVVLIALPVSLVWGVFAIWLGPKIGFMDDPDASGLKTHTRATSSLGGVGVFLGVHVALAVVGEASWALFGASSVVLVLGLVDDRVGLSPALRIVVEVAAGVILVVGWSTGSKGLWLMVFGVLLVVFAVNAVNLFDGLDGLAASAAAVSGVGLALLAGSRGLSSALPVAVASALVGYLVVGWHPARVFLGDAGAYVVGLFLAAAALQASPGGGWPLIVACGTFGVLAIDLAVTLLRRWRSGSPLFLGDRGHLYDQLRGRGLGVRRVVLLSAALQVALVAVVMVGEWTLSPVAAAGLAALGSIVALVFLGRAGFLLAENG